MIPRIDSSWTLFLDRDGVLNRKVENGYVLNPSMLEIIPGAPEAVSSLGGRFGTIVIVTNQRGIARGLMTPDDLARVNASLLEAIRREGGRIDAIFVCPHDLQEECNCRKPKAGLALKAKERFSRIEFAKSVLVGDSDTDIKMGKELGMFTIRIGRGTGNEAGDMLFSSLFEFARGMAGSCVANSESRKSAGPARHQ